MRVTLSVALGMCLLAPGLARVQATTGPQTPPAAATPQAPAQDRKEIKVTEKILKTYVGEYEMGPGRVLTITLDKGTLWGQPTDQEKRQLFAESNTKFFLKDLPVQVTFQKDAKGAVTGLIMDQEGRPQREAKKIK
jgi:Domain of unknown function (DUF3471)